jgi:hypothetical protein
MRLRLHVRICFSWAMAQPPSAVQHNVRPTVLPYNNPRQNHEVVQTAVTVDTQRRRRVAELAQYVREARLSR